MKRHPILAWKGAVLGHSGLALVDDDHLGPFEIITVPILKKTNKQNKTH